LPKAHRIVVASLAWIAMASMACLVGLLAARNARGRKIADWRRHDAVQFASRARPRSGRFHGPCSHVARNPGFGDAQTPISDGTNRAWRLRCTKPIHHWSDVMAKKSPVDATLEDLLYQALETELGGVQIYETALTCAVNEDLGQEWQEYLEQTRSHVQHVLGLLGAFGLDPDAQPPSRAVVGGIGNALVEAMKKAKATLTPEQAELVACEAVVLAETKDHSNWELLAFISKEARHAQLQAIRTAVEHVEGDEDHHLYHTKGWCRELWIRALGFPAVLPPPEEVKQVETAIGASRAEQARKGML
jgi:hypothetical protein